MSKRKINKQQRARINTIQTNFQDSSNLNEKNQHQGLVLSRFGHHAEIEISNQRIIFCAIRPHLSNIVAGDQVICLEETPGLGVVVSLLPRQSVLTRLNKHKDLKIIAANITQIVIVAAPIPEPNWLLIDSYLVKAEHDKIKPLIVFNKSDISLSQLSNAPDHHPHASRFQASGYEYIETSCLTGKGLELLFQKLSGETSVFAGQSGVGKSSLIASCLPDLSIAIAEQNVIHHHGRHTTSNARLYHLPQGGDLIDSPGIRGFDLSDLNKEAIVSGFKEFKELAKKCQFRNCNHQNITICAIAQAVNQGLCDKSRYESLLALLAQN